MKNNSQKIIFRLPNWVGDVMMALPGIFFLNDLGFEIHLIGKKWISDLLKASPFHLHFLDKGLRKNIAKLKKIPADKMILFPNSFSSAFMAKFAGKKTAAFPADFRSLLLNLKIKKEKGAHEAEYFWSLIREAGRIWWPDRNFPETLPGAFEFPLDDEASRSAQKIITRISKPFIIICPSALGKNKEGESKIWPHWIALAERLQAENKKVIACPGPGEEEFFRKNFPNITLLENIKLNVYAALMKEADWVIANDSGPLHLAAAVNQNVIGIFGATDPTRTRPLSGKFLGQAGRWPTLTDIIHQLKRE